MNRFLRGSLLAALLTTQPALATELAGTHIDDRASVAGNELVLNGAGLRTRFMLKVYTIGLYLPKRSESAVSAITGTGAKRIQITTLRDLSAEDFANALIDGVRKNHGEADLANLQGRLDEFRTTLLGIRAAPNGTQVRIDWLPASGTRLSIGNETRGKDIPGEDFFRALLRIWIGDKPVDEDLKNALLGKR
ncbi:chalcone isomerase family protein [Zoogloea sp.]|uniref:chalcone isomerase family protein n=1 Tax=Zoogloea sp. TaxID=49181 RepID=UPI001AD4A05E|nr:chalcone isomerase family protein [Zoogloea sp.]MBN8283730.1 chalcone isomerase family protein [Zoogloea sp.]